MASWMFSALGAMWPSQMGSWKYFSRVASAGLPQTA